mgnify:CR=1 FL=1
MKRTVTLLAGLLIAFAGAAQGKPSAPVALEYVQASPLTAGQPVEIVVTLKPTSDEVDHVDVEFRGAKGLVVLAGQSLSTTGEKKDHRLTVSAAANGRYYLTATIRTDDSVRVVAVPVVVGNGVARVSGQSLKIRSLPAQE